MSKTSKKVFFAIFILIIILLAVGYYFFFFHKNTSKTFSQSPENAQAISAFNSDNPDQAISAINNYLQKNPNDISAQLLLASSYVLK